MKISDVRAYTLSCPLKKPWRIAGITMSEMTATIVEVESETGLTGYGEALTRLGPGATREIIESILRPILIGADPLEVDVLWERMFAAMMAKKPRISGGSTSATRCLRRIEACIVILHVCRVTKAWHATPLWHPPQMGSVVNSIGRTARNFSGKESDVGGPAQSRWNFILIGCKTDALERFLWYAMNSACCFCLSQRSEEVTT